MNNRLEKWEILGLLAKTPENKKEFVANTLQLLLAHLNYEFKEEQDGNFETLIFPIITRIGNEREVRENMKNLENLDDEDVMLSFTEKYCENKIKNMGKLNVIPYELKKTNRFLVEFPEQFNIETWAVQKINKPKYTNGVWEDIKIEFIDPIGPSTSQCLFEIVNFLKRNVNDSNDKKLFDIKIKSLDPTGVDVEKWVVNVEKVLTINFGELDYDSDKTQQPCLILKPLNCILNY
jgi:hypothetical protein